MQKQLTVTVARNVGALYEDQGKLDMAAEMFRRVLKMCDDAWGSGAYIHSIHCLQLGHRLREARQGG
jgi:hypothetical protein